MVSLQAIKEQSQQACPQQGRCQDCPEPALKLEKVNLEYCQGTCALSEVSFEVKSGQHLAIMGPSGSGKTSLLRCIAKRVSPQCGKVDCQQKVATIHQDYRLVEERSALANVLHGVMGRYSLFRTLLFFPRSEKKRAKQLLERVGLGERIYFPVKKLSGGEKQRVAIARALMQDPEILLADEPVASLDEDCAHEIMELLDGLRQERGLTLISVLHDFGLAKHFADRVLRLVKGRIVYDIDQSEQSLPAKSARLKKEEALEKLGEKAVPLKPSLPSAVHTMWLLLAFAVVYFWSFRGLEIESAQLKDSAGNLWTFLGSLLPTSIAELRNIPWGVLLSALVETLQMAVLGTTFGVLIAWPLAAIAAGNVGAGPLRTLVRFSLNAIRTVPSLIWALLFVAAVGLGSFAGVLALIAYSVGYLSKFFYEAFESVDPGPPEALQELGARGLQRFFHAIWPAAAPAVLSSSLFMLEYNVRAASVLGVVDAGGIGFYIKQYIDFRAFPAVCASLLMILAVVVILDFISSKIREKLL